MDRRRRRSTYSTYRKKGSLILCIAVVIVVNIFMLIYYILNPTRRILHSVVPMGFIFSRIIVIVIFGVITTFIALYYLTYLKLISLFNIFLIVAELIFGFYFVFLLVIKVDNFLDQYYTIDSSLQEEIINLYGCCFDELPGFNVTEFDMVSSSTLSTLTKSPSTLSTMSTSIPTTSVGGEKKKKLLEDLKSRSENDTCSSCRFKVKEQIRNVATILSTGFILSEVFMGAVLILMVAQVLKIIT